MLKLEDVYDVVIAKDGQEAYDKVKESMSEKQFFDLIFMDIQVSPKVLLRLEPFTYRPYRCPILTGCKVLV